jgi:ATP-dependent Clp protease ATP-binding subunit ClpA
VKELSKALVDALLWARVIAPRYGARELFPEHLLLGMLRGPVQGEDAEQSVSAIFGLSGTFLGDLSTSIERLAIRGDAYEAQSGDLFLSEKATEVIQRGSSLADKLGHDAIRPLHVLWAILEADATLAEILKVAGIDNAAVELALRKGAFD